VMPVSRSVASTPSKQVPLMRPMVLTGTMDVPVESG
jgi:hypothetical protein